MLLRITSIVLHRLKRSVLGYCCSLILFIIYKQIQYHTPIGTAGHFSLKRNKSHHMHTQRNQHICGLEFVGCYIPLDAVQASRKNQMLISEKQIPHYPAHMGTQAGDTQLSAGTFSFYNTAWKDKKPAPKIAPKDFRLTAVAPSSKLEDFSPFSAVFPAPPVLLKEGQYLQHGSRFSRSFCLFFSLQQGSPLALVREVTMNCWATEQGLSSDAGNSVKKSSATIPNSGSSCMMTFVCTFAESKFTPRAEAQTLHGMPGFQYTVSCRVALTSEKKRKKSTCPKSLLFNPRQRTKERS